MSLICHICHNQLFTFLPIHNGKTNFAKINCNSINNKNLGMNTKQVKDAVGKLNQSQSQTQNMKVCSTSCGHLFHRDCLKELFNIRPGLPYNNKTPKICPQCNQKFRYGTCITVHKDCFPTVKVTKTSGKLEDVMLKTQKMHEKLYVLKKKLSAKEHKYAKILKKIEQLKSIDSFTPPPTTWASVSKSSTFFPNQACPSRSSSNMNPVSASIPDPIVANEDEIHLGNENYEDMKTKLLELFSQSKEMERSMYELQASMSNFQYCLELNYRTTTTRNSAYSKKPDSSSLDDSPGSDPIYFDSEPEPVVSPMSDELEQEEPEFPLSGLPPPKSFVDTDLKFGQSKTKPQAPSPSVFAKGSRNEIEKSRQADFQRIFMGHSTKIL